MKRAVKLSLKFCTASKRKRINALVDEQRRAVNAYIPTCHVLGCKLDAETKSTYHGGHLSSRQCSAALNQAISIVKANNARWGSKAQLPTLKGAVIYSNTCAVEAGRGSFDIVVKLASLTKGSPLLLPTKGTKVLRKWLDKPGAKLVQGCAISEDSLTVWVDIPQPEATSGMDTAAVDIGFKKVMAFTNGSDTRLIGRGFADVATRVQMARPGSKGAKRARASRDAYIDLAVKQLSWETLNTIFVENLKHLKTGKKKNRSKAFRKKLIPWSYSRVLKRIEETAQSHRVALVRVNPAFTSLTCPDCRAVDRMNRTGESFRCVACGYAEDADIVGARNILARGLSDTNPGSVRSPSLQPGSRRKAKT